MQELKKTSTLAVSPIVDYYENELPHDGMWYNPVDLGYRGRYIEPGIQPIC